MRFKNLLVLVALAGSLSLIGCSENYDLTKVPISVDIYVDSTYSNNEVDLECMEDVMEAAKLAAGSQGNLSFHTFDGDPFHSRGLNESFSDLALPGEVEGSDGQTGYLENKAEELRPRMEELVEADAVVPETPLIGLLMRAGRGSTSSAIRHILICTDGLFTDLNPNHVSIEDAKTAGKDLPPTLKGVVVDFIGLDASAPDRGEFIERTRPLVLALLTSAEADLGSWDLELPANWRKDLIDIANPGDDE